MPRKTAASPAVSAYGRALGKLSRRDHAEGELRLSLRRAGHGQGEIDEAVARLKGQRALDDRRFAETFSRSRLRHRGLGSRRIEAALRHRGVARPVAEAGLRAAKSEVEEGDALDALARSYWKQRAADQPKRRLQKLWAFLLRRGYPADLVNTRLRALWPRLRDALDGLEPGEEVH